MPADIQLADGLALAAGAAETGVPALRWSSIEQPALVLGVAQQLHQINRVACTNAGLSVYRRASGGGAVLCDESLLMLELALPREHPLCVSDVTASYQWLGTAWIGTLGALGVDAQLVAIDAARAATRALDPLMKRVCFAGISPYEVVVGPRKIVGLAQLRSRNSVLFQAALYLRWQPQRTADFIAQTPDEHARLTAWLAERVVGLEEQSGRAVAAAEVMHSFETILEAQTGLQLLDDTWNDGERAAQAASRARFAALVL
jgi:lipoate-protein ligase A